eukprot:TRINITY_DN59669_c0_g1_i1.p1 TRINITY_DN59669_c0_g1~~TRINITY_DN59669_c0_g1_i1.p1  ORF type:complete len:161 (-),score=26.50 TRINITY_DN59669_c0_g1_i1:110-592(-)
MQEKPTNVAFPIPKSQLLQLIKKTLPNGAVVSSQSKAAFSRAVSLFIMCTTCHAYDNARRNKRQGITANDVLHSLDEMGFEQWSQELSALARPKEPKAKKEKKETKTDEKGQTPKKTPSGRKRGRPKKEEPTAEVGAPEEGKQKLEGEPNPTNNDDAMEQ